MHTHTQLHELGSLARSQKGRGENGQPRETCAHARFSSHSPNRHATLSCAPLPTHWLDNACRRRNIHAQTHMLKGGQGPLPSRALGEPFRSLLPSAEVEESPATRGKQSCTFQATSWVCVPAYDSSPLAGVRGCGHSPSLVYIPIHPVCIHICICIYIYILRMYR